MSGQRKEGQRRRGRERKNERVTEWKRYKEKERKKEGGSVIHKAQGVPTGCAKRAQKKRVRKKQYWERKEKGRNIILVKRAQR